MMTWFSSLIVTLIILSANPSLSIPLRFPNLNFPAEAGHSLLGDAHFVGGGHSVQLSRTTPPSFGIILGSTPFKFNLGTSFSSNFTFQIGNGVALVIIPADFPYQFARNMSFALLDAKPFLGIEFDINVCKLSSSRVSISNVSKINHVLEGGVKLSSWIDYHAILKRIDVRISKLGDPRPVEPLISYRIDLGKMCKGEEVLLGIASSNGNHEQITTVYSWSSEIEDIPQWLHSMPAIPKDFAAVGDDLHTSKKRGFLPGFLFGVSCGSVAALVLLFVWAYATDKQKTEAEPRLPPVDFKYEKIDVLEVKDSETGMK